MALHLGTVSRVFINTGAPDIEALRTKYPTFFQSKRVKIELASDRITDSARRKVAEEVIECVQGYYERNVLKNPVIKLQARL